MAKKDQPQQGVAEQLQPLVDDDAFLTTLSEGTDPSDGGDELAGLLLELRGDVEKQMPPAPLIEGAEEEPEVISLGAARRRRSKPFMHGLIGAAAATLLIAGTGAVVVNAGPGSPLYGVNQSLFGADDHDVSVVELAGTLDEMERRSAEGDMDGTRQLLEEARKMVDQAKREREAESPSAAKQQPRTTVTQTQTVEKPAPVEEQKPPEPETVTQTETAVSTVVVTRTVSAGNPLEPPTQGQPEPSQPGGGEQATPPQNDNSDGAGDSGQLPPPQFQQ